MKKFSRFCCIVLGVLLIRTVFLFVYYIADDLLDDKTNEIISPAESAKILTQFYIYGDKSGVKKLGMSDDEIQSALEKGKEVTKEVLRSNVKSLGYSVTDNQLEEYYDALMEASKKLTVKTKFVSQKGNIAIVSIKVNSIPFNEISYKSLSKVENQLSKIGEKAYNNVECKLYIDGLIDELKNVEPSQEFSKEEVAFVRNGNGWFPVNNDVFASTIDNLITK